MAENYFDRMNKFVSYYNGSDTLEEKNKALSILLLEMYRNKYNKDLNYGLLATVCCTPKSPSIIACFPPGAKLCFDAENNQLELGDVPLTGEISLGVDDYGGNLNSDDYGKGMFFEIPRVFDNDGVRFIITKSGNRLVIDHNFRRKNKYRPSFTLFAPESDFSSFEIRDYDVCGIEVERRISSKMKLGLPGTERTDGKMFVAALSEIEDETVITRDSNYFMLGKVNNVRSIDNRSDNTIHLGTSFLDVGTKRIRTTSETYTLIDSVYSLDCRMGYFSEDEKDDKIRSYIKHLFEIEDIDKRTSRGISLFDEKIDFFPGINDAFQDSPKKQ